MAVLYQIQKRAKVVYGFYFGRYRLDSGRSRGYVGTDEGRKELTRLYILLALFFPCGRRLFARLLSRTITRPIVSLEAAMKEVEKGHFEKVR